MRSSPWLPRPARLLQVAECLAVLPWGKNDVLLCGSKTLSLQRAAVAIPFAALRGRSRGGAPVSWGGARLMPIILSALSWFSSSRGALSYVCAEGWEGTELALLVGSILAWQKSTGFEVRSSVKSFEALTFFPLLASSFTLHLSSPISLGFPLSVLQPLFFFEPPGLANLWSSLTPTCLMFCTVSQVPETTLRLDDLLRGYMGLIKVLQLWLWFIEIKG